MVGEDVNSTHNCNLPFCPFPLSLYFQVNPIPFYFTTFLSIPIPIQYHTHQELMKSRHHLPLFKCKLLKPCKKFLHLLRFKLRKPLFLPSLRFHHRKHNTQRATHKWRFSRILSIFRYQRDTREMDRVTEFTSFSDALHYKAPHPSPLTPARTRTSRAIESDDDDDVEDACRSFEKYLKEMMVEDGKMRDLVDVEELLYCWKNLTSPVFLDLFCTFYTELCKDLFSNTSHNDIIKTPKRFMR